MLGFYNQCVKRPSYNFVMGASLLIIYELTVAFFPTGTLNGVDALLQSFLKLIPFSTLIISVLLLVSGVYFLYDDRKEGFHLRGDMMALMFLESTFWAFFILFTIPYLVGKLLLQQIGIDNLNFIQKIGFSCGAGFYEEFFFRFLLVSGLQKFLNTRGFETRNLMIIIMGAFLFSMAHYIGAYGDNFTMNSFLQRFLFGLFMNFLFVIRGFGITACSHAFYDIIVFNLR